MITEPSGDYAARHLALAQELLDDAQANLQQDRLRTALDRAYYAMFYAAQAVLIARGLQPPRTHKGVISLFGREVVKTGLVQREMGRWLSRGLGLRRLGTYDVDLEPDREQVEAMVRGAEVFVSSGRSLIRKLP